MKQKLINSLDEILIKIAIEKVNFLAKINHYWFKQYRDYPDSDFFNEISKNYKINKLYEKAEKILKQIKYY